MTKASDFLISVGLPGRDANELPTSAKRFADGAAWRVEIPSWKGRRRWTRSSRPRVRHVTIHRVSQGSGIMLQTDDEIRDMLAIGKQHGIEVCLFVGPRANWDRHSGVQHCRAAGAGSSLRGADQLRFAIDDVLHGVSLGLQLDARGRPRSPVNPRRDEKGRRFARGLRAQDIGDDRRGQSGDRAAARRSRARRRSTCRSTCRSRRLPRSARRSTRQSTSTSRRPTTSAARCGTTRPPSSCGSRRRSI